MDFAVSADHRIKPKECEKKDKYLDLARELKKTMEQEGDKFTYCDWCFWYNNKRIIKATGGLGSYRTIGDHSNYSTTENGENTGKSLETWGDLLSLRLHWKTISFNWCENS